MKKALFACWVGALVPCAFAAAGEGGKHPARKPLDPEACEYKTTDVAGAFPTHKISTDDILAADDIRRKCENGDPEHKKEPGIAYVFLLPVPTENHPEKAELHAVCVADRPAKDVRQMAVPTTVTLADGRKIDLKQKKLRVTVYNYSGIPLYGYNRSTADLRKAASLGADPMEAAYRRICSGKLKTPTNYEITSCKTYSFDPSDYRSKATPQGWLVGEAATDCDGIAKYKDQKAAMARLVKRQVFGAPVASAVREKNVVTAKQSDKDDPEIKGRTGTASSKKSASGSHIR